MKRKLLAIILSVMMVLSLSTVAGATSIQSEGNSSENGVITPYADEIIYYYRVNNGVLQYRRWNATRGYWVDANWINC